MAVVQKAKERQYIYIYTHTLEQEQFFQISPEPNSKLCMHFVSNGEFWIFVKSHLNFICTTNNNRYVHHHQRTFYNTGLAARWTQKINTLFNINTALESGQLLWWHFSIKTSLKCNLYDRPSQPGGPTQMSILANTKQPMEYRSAYAASKENQSFYIIVQTKITEFIITWISNVNSSRTW